MTSKFAASQIETRQSRMHIIYVPKPRRMPPTTETAYLLSTVECHRLDRPSPFWLVQFRLHHHGDHIFHLRFRLPA
jgi:hypothetical protein